MFEMSTNTVSITDYELRTPTLAKVILSFTGKQNKESIRASLAKKMNGLATVVEGSFRIVRDGVAVGFVRANREVRPVTPQELQSKYKVVSSNTFMSAEDRSLWTKEDGKCGSYLARQGKEDLSELMTASCHRRTDLPCLRHLAHPVAAKSELVAFVTPEGSMDYGFAVAQDTNRVKVVSFYGRVPKIVAYTEVVGLVPIQVDKATHQAVTAGIAPKDKGDAVAYWKQLYAYDPAYMQEVIDQVEADATA